MRAFGMGLILLVCISLLVTQLAFFPFFTNYLTFYFHGLFLFAPLAVGALYYRLSEHVGYSLITGVAVWIHASLMPIDYYEKALAHPLYAIVYVMVGSMVIWCAVVGVKRVLAAREAWGRSRLRTWGCFQVAMIAALLALNLILPLLMLLFSDGLVALGEMGNAIIQQGMVLPSLLASTLINSVVFAASMIWVDALIRRSVADEEARTLRRVFQRWLLLVVAAAFLICNSVSYCIETLRADRDAQAQLASQVEYLSSQVSEYSAREASIKASEERLILDKAQAVAHILENNPERANDEDYLVEMCDALNLSSIAVCDGDGIVITEADTDDSTGFDFADSEFTRPYLELLSGSVDHIVEEPRASVTLDGQTGPVRVFAGIPRTDDDGFIQVSIPGDEYRAALDTASVENLANSYSVGKGGLVLISKGNDIVSSNDPEYRGSTLTEMFVADDEGIPEEDNEAYQEALSRTIDMMLSGEIIPMQEEGTFGVTLTKGARVGDYGVLVQIPSLEVYANRTVTILLNAFIFLLIFASMFALATILLNRVVVQGFLRTNQILARITEGDLDQRIDEHETVEFDELSDGINTTVSALKGWIAEAEHRMEYELSTAKAIQESALPRTFPPFPEIETFDIYASMNAAKEVGGDFYDFFEIDDHTIGFLIADVSGKGVPASLFMMAAKTEIENYMSAGMELAEAILSANHHLCKGNDAGMFVTVWAATLDWQTGQITYCNAGHNFPLVRRGNGGSWEWLNKKCGLFLGTFETAKYRQETLALEPGDELILYTDGVNEAFSADGEEYGNDRLEAFLAEHNDLHPRQLVEELRTDVAKWAEGAEQSDDITMLCLEYGIAPEVTGSMTVPAQVDQLNAVREMLHNELGKRLCPLGVENALDIALEELFVNVCNYAYANQEELGTVTVSYRYEPDPKSMTIEIDDSGVAFNPLEHTRPAIESLDDFPVGGLGIMMATKSVDDIAYMRDGDWNRIVFTKRW
ncbi:MAG: SpoIIE family protein phosphatase [Coriobacteriales bacterium]|nr:SpoIIE family protein phosphatase [Coriobacteriales bacterium]